jgi:UDP-glucose 6-dehydrogenase
MRPRIGGIGCVAGLGVDQARLEALQDAWPPFYEPGLEPILRKHIVSGRLPGFTPVVRRSDRVR